MPTPNERPCYAEAEWTILDLLLDAAQPMTVSELVSQIGSPVAVAEALDALHVAGLIEHTGEVVRIAPAPPDTTR